MQSVLIDEKCDVRRREGCISMSIDIISSVKIDLDLVDEKQLKDILEIFPYIHWEASSAELAEKLSIYGHKDPGKILRNSYYENILCISTIENDGTVYFDLGFLGEDLWKEMNQKKKQEMWNSACML